MPRIDTCDICGEPGHITRYNKQGRSFDRYILCSVHEIHSEIVKADAWYKNKLDRISYLRSTREETYTIGEIRNEIETHDKNLTTEQIKMKKEVEEVAIDTV